jgi:hypothetical protein
MFKASAPNFDVFAMTEAAAIGRRATMIGSYAGFNAVPLVPPGPWIVIDFWKARTEHPHDRVPDFKTRVLDRDRQTVERPRPAKCHEIAARLQHVECCPPCFDLERHAAAIPRRFHEPGGHGAIWVGIPSLTAGQRSRAFSAGPTVRYQSARPDDRPLRERMIAIARERRRFGYRRLHVLLKREGHLVNHKRLFRLYREEKLAVRQRGGRKRAIGTRAPMQVPLTPNERWSLDFVSDQFTGGRRFRVLAILDDCTRENLALLAGTSLSGLRVARELDSVIAGRGRPR